MSDPIINGNVLSLNNLTPSQNARYTNYLYIKGRGPIIADQKRQLAELGVTIFEYLGKDTYLCRYEPSDLQPLRDLPFVDHANVYPTRVKVTQLLADAISAGAQPDADADTHTPPATFNIDVVLHKGEHDIDRIVSDVVERTGISPDTIEITHNQLRIIADAAAISEIEKLDAVKTIDQFVPKKLFNNVARGDIEVANEAISPTEIHFKGHGQVVAISDTGFDTGSTSETHPAFKDRVVALIPIGRANTGETNDFNGHGTHVAGSVLGDGYSESMGGKIRGTAPKATLVMQALSTAGPRSGLKTPQNLWDLWEEPYRKHGARVASNSWGADWEYSGSRQLGYNAESGAIDRFVWHNQDHVIVFAAGNDGMRASETNAHIGSSSAAKNCICVGATESTRPSTRFAYDPKKSTPGQPNKVAAFSSRGPTLEKRLKPDVVAPGVAILSAGSRDRLITDRMRSEYGPSTDKLWMFSSGTSMATPLVSGCCAVLREALIKTKNMAKPSAALIKALLVNGAVDTGRPREEQGFGRVSLKNSLGFLTGDGSGIVDMIRLEEGQSWSQEISAPRASGNLRVTMAYSDRYGAALQNNLSLKVKVDGGEEKSGDDGHLAENNAEKVIVKMEMEGNKAVISVMAERIARLGDSQPFALVWGFY